MLQPAVQSRSRVSCFAPLLDAPNVQQICLSDVTLLKVCRSATTERPHRETKQYWSRLYESSARLGCVFGLVASHLRGAHAKSFHQWRLYWANNRIGRLDPPQIGAFHEGRGDFYTTETISGKTILIRYDGSRMTSATPHFEQAFSPDGGRTWEVNWITDQTRTGDAAWGQPEPGCPITSPPDTGVAPPSGVRDGQHDSDWGAYPLQMLPQASRCSKSVRTSRGFFDDAGWVSSHQECPSSRARLPASTGFGSVGSGAALPCQSPAGPRETRHRCSFSCPGR